MNDVCERYQDDLVAEACSALPPDESRSLHDHLVGCAGCREALDRLQTALAPLAAYRAEPPADLVRTTQRYVARQMTMRLPRPSRWRRPRVIRFAAAAAMLLIMGTMYLATALQPNPTDVQLRGLYKALHQYAAVNDDQLPPSLEALYRDGQGGEDAEAGPGGLSDEFIFLEGLSRWMDLGSKAILVVCRKAGPNNQHLVLLRDGRTDLISETEARRVSAADPSPTHTPGADRGHD